MLVNSLTFFLTRCLVSRKSLLDFGLTDILGRFYCHSRDGPVRGGGKSVIDLPQETNSVIL